MCASDAIQGICRLEVHKNAVLVAKGKQLYGEEFRRRTGRLPVLMFQVTAKSRGARKRANLQRRRGKANLRYSVVVSKTLLRLAQLVHIVRRPIAARLRYG